MSSGSPLPASLLVSWFNADIIEIIPSKVTSHNDAPVNLDYLQKINLSPLSGRALISFKYTSPRSRRGRQRNLKNLNECYLQYKTLKSLKIYYLLFLLSVFILAIFIVIKINKNQN